ncbi:MAG: hypothetical protein KAT27_08940 [Desulfobacterales bacterium]|nr:hypothetical protein [Desulfobacterales bacterium]
MKKGVILVLLVASFIVELPVSAKEIIELKEVGNKEILDIRDRLTASVQELSILKAKLDTIFRSMNAHAKDRFLIMRCSKNITDITRICTYITHNLGHYLRVPVDKKPYYLYLEGYGLGRMIKQENEHYADIQRIYAQLLNKDAVRILDQAKETLQSSSKLLDRLVQVMGLHLQKRNTEDVSGLEH